MGWHVHRKIPPATTQNRGQARGSACGTQGRQHRGVSVQHRLYYHLNPAHIREKNPVFDGHVVIDLNTYGTKHLMNARWKCWKNTDLLLISLIHNNAAGIDFKFSCQKHYRWSHENVRMYPVFEENELIVLILWIYNNAKRNSFNLLFTYSLLFFRDTKNTVRFSHENVRIHPVFRVWFDC